MGDAVYGEILSEHHRLIRQALENNNGREESTAGDSFFAVFTSPRECVAAAVEMQKALSSHQWANGESVRVRMGIHTGEVSTNSTGFVGYEVHRAARISAIGHGGQVLLSAATATLLGDSIADGVFIKELGAHRLKDLGRPEEIFQLDIKDLKSEFPPLRSLDNPELPNNLPTSLNHFIGRETELAELREVTNESRLVTLTGAGGSGKTRLALQAAVEMLGHQGDGVWFVELAPISDPDQVATAIANAMDLSYDGVGTALEALQKALKDQSVVLVIDNCEHVVESVADVLEQLVRSCPKVRFIATSREPLGVMGEVVYRVRSLSLPSSDAVTAEELEKSDSVQLFVQRAGALDRSFAVTDANASLVASICRRLDGIPLAIELAAARLASMSLEDLNKRLDQRFRLLTGGSRNALPRQQTLGAMVAWSYDLLNEKERQVLRRLTIFVGTFDLAAAENVASCEVIDEWDIADILGSLVNKSLVIGDHIGKTLRYRVLETIRQYGVEQLLQVDGEEALSVLRQKHANYYLQLCIRLEPQLHTAQQVEAFTQLDFDRENIGAALSAFRDEPDGALNVLRICNALLTFSITRFWRESFEQLAWAVSQLQGSKSVEHARGWLNHLSFENWMRFSENLPPLDNTEAMAEILATSRELGDVHLEISTLLWRSFALQRGVWGKGNQESYEVATQALQLAQQKRDSYLIGLCELRLGRSTGDSDQRKQHFENSLAEFKKVESPVDIAESLFSISSAIEGSAPEQHSRRIMLLKECWVNAEKIGDLARIDQCVTYLGLYTLAIGDYEEAERFCRLALSSCIRLGRGTAYFGWLALSMARVSAERGNFERAVKLLGWMLKELPDTDEMFAGAWAPEEREFARFIDEEGRKALGEGKFEELYKFGYDLNLSQATDLMRQAS